jgi:membrane fusion protein (multidrug efflux system)
MIERLIRYRNGFVRGVTTFHIRTLIRTLFVVAVVLGGALLNEGVRAQNTPPDTVPVGIVVAQKESIISAQEYVGRVEAINRVEIRARVTGYLQAVLFKEGDLIRKGAPLFQIEREPFQAAVQQAQGELIKAQGQYANAEVALRRAEELLGSKAGSVATRDQRKAEEQTAQGNVVIAHANLTTAQVNLGYTDITAPITGRIGRAAVTAGNVVGPNSGPLALMVSQDPIYVVFPVSERELLAIRKEGRAAEAAALKVRVIFADGSTYGQTGTIDFVGVTVNQQTDTVTVRAVFPNPNDVLLDGQLLRVAVEAAKPEEKVLVPQAALIADQQGTYVFIVKDGKAEVRRVKLGGERGADAVIDEGLAGGEQVVVQGLQALRPGTAVTATPVPATGQL